MCFSFLQYMRRQGPRHPDGSLRRKRRVPPQSSPRLQSTSNPIPVLFLEQLSSFPGYRTFPNTGVTILLLVCVQVIASSAPGSVVQVRISQLLSSLLHPLYKVTTELTFENLSETCRPARADVAVGGGGGSDDCQRGAVGGADEGCQGYHFRTPPATWC